MSDKNNSGWGIYDDGEGIVHIHPVDEDHDKETSWSLLHVLFSEPPKSECKCHPRVEPMTGENSWLIIHGAFDGREAMEEVDKLLNNQ